MFMVRINSGPHYDYIYAVLLFTTKRRLAFESVISQEYRHCNNVLGKGHMHGNPNCKL